MAYGRRGGRKSFRHSPSRGRRGRRKHGKRIHNYYVSRGGIRL